MLTNCYHLKVQSKINLMKEMGQVEVQADRGILLTINKTIMKLNRYYYFADIHAIAELWWHVLFSLQIYTQWTTGVLG